MYNDVECCNIAILRCKGNVIETLGEDSREGTLCKRLFPYSRDCVLAEHLWTFAKTEADLALLPESEKFSNFDFAYAYPNDCVRPWYIVNPSSRLPLDQIEYEVANRKGSNGASKVLLTNVEVPKLIYTRQILYISSYPISVFDAVTWRLSMELSMSLQGDETRARSFKASYQSALEHAKSVDANSEYEHPVADNKFKRSRR